MCAALHIALSHICNAITETKFRLLYPIFFHFIMMILFRRLPVVNAKPTQEFLLNGFDIVHFTSSFSHKNFILLQKCRECERILCANVVKMAGKMLCWSVVSRQVKWQCDWHWQRFYYYQIIPTGLRVSVYLRTYVCVCMQFNFGYSFEFIYSSLGEYVGVCVCEEM